MGGGIFDESDVEIKSYDFNTSVFQDDNHLYIIGKKKWGNNFKTIIKYLVLRFF